VVAVVRGITGWGAAGRFLVLGLDELFHTVDRGLGWKRVERVWSAGDLNGHREFGAPVALGFEEDVATHLDGTIVDEHAERAVWLESDDLHRAFDGGAGPCADATESGAELDRALEEGFERDPFVPARVVLEMLNRDELEDNRGGTIDDR